MDYAIFYQLGLAVGLGLLVGLQREWAATDVAGIRTFPLIAMFGVLCVILANAVSPWILPAGLLCVAAMLFLSNLMKLKKGNTDPGLTTEIAALVMFCLGALLALRYISEALAVGGSVAVLLHWKERMHQFVKNIGGSDIRAIFQFVLIALVILPILPNKTFDPYKVLNPFEIWLMVVLIVGISLGAYVAYQIFGKSVGLFMAGIFGGLISSTATTVSYAKQTREDEKQTDLAASIIMISSAVVFVRVLFEIWLIAENYFLWVASPLLIMMCIMSFLALHAFRKSKNKLPAPKKDSPPSDLKTAIGFGLLYALVILALSIAHQHFHSQGLYVVAALSGLTDVDAITLSTAQLLKARSIEPEMAWRLILLGAMANLLFKGGVIWLLGARGLAHKVTVQFALALLGGVLLFWLWPG